MGKTSRDKGKRGEREAVALAWKHKLCARRTWETASGAGDSRVDIEVTHSEAGLGGFQLAHPARLRGQVKMKASGFGALYLALDGVEVAFVRQASRRDKGLPWLAIVRAEEFLKLMARGGPTR